MDSEYAGFIEELLKKPEFQCPVCGKGRYVTDHGNHEVTIHCSSSDAKFWEFDRGSLAQTIAKQHWDQSRLELFLTMEDVLKCLRPDDPVPERSQPASSQRKGFR